VEAVNNTNDVRPSIVTPTTILSPTDVDWTQLDDLPRPFDSVSSDLTSLGALSVEDFLSNATSSTAVFDVAFYVQLPEATTPGKDKHEEVVDENEELKVNDQQRALRAFVATLHETCHKVFGSSDCLKFEYMEEDPNSELLAWHLLSVLTNPSAHR